MNPDRSTAPEIKPRLRHRLFAGLVAWSFACVAPVALAAAVSVAPVSPTELSVPGESTGAESLRDFTSGWRFHLGAVAGAEQPAFSDSGWRVLDLPHDWSIETPHDPNTPEGSSVGYLRGGTGWYRKQFQLAPADAGRAVEVVFDGVQQDCDVWINGTHLGFQPHGYIGFVHTLTPHLRPAGQPNVIAVRAVNPDRNTRWYAGSGIYRDVRLRVRSPVDVATWGLLIETSWITKSKAQLQLRADLRNDTDTPQEVDLALRLHKPDGTTEDVDLGSVRLSARSAGQVGQRFDIDAPKLWSPASPTLYKAELLLLQSGVQIGGLSQMFGIRQVLVSASGGFRLNGEQIELKGACLHHDNGLIGAAAFATAEWRRVEVMKRNGFNAIRTSHNPPSTAFLDACDRLGVLVIDEFADMWELPKKTNGYNRYFAGHWEKDLCAMLHRDFNHPSVVIWSIGNEVQERAKPLGIDIARRMIDCIRRIDRQRPITNAHCGFWDNPDWTDQWDRTAPAFALLDIGGYNYQRSEYERDHAKYPDRVMAGTESFPVEAYENWRAVEKLPYVIGDFVWTGMDHIGESGIGSTGYHPPADVKAPPLMPWPTWINWSGDIDTTGQKKPQSFYRDVVWDNTLVEILVHAPVPAGTQEAVSRWGWPDELPSWNWPGQDGRSLAVRVVSKSPRVRLELNGKVVGEQSINLEKGITSTFDVPYTPGELKATALAADGNVLGSRTLATAGVPSALAIAPELARAKASRDALVYVPVEIRDEAGRLVPDAAIPIRATVDGAAELLAFGAASPTAMGVLRDGDTETFRGRALLILRSTGKPGRVHVKMTSPNLAPAEAAFDLR